MAGIEGGRYQPPQNNEAAFKAGPPGGAGGGDRPLRIPEVARGVVLTPSDEEYQRYSELLQGFFEKLTRWQEILFTEGLQEYDRRHIISGFSVYHLDNGLTNSKAFPRSVPYSDPPYVNPYLQRELDPPNKVLEVAGDSYTKAFSYDRDFSMEELDYSHIAIRPGPAGRQLLTDPEGKPIPEVWIMTGDKTLFEGPVFPSISYSPDVAHLTISSHTKPQVSVEYRFNKQTQTLTLHSYHKLMSEAYQSHLFKTIDALIPNRSVSSSQLGTQGSQGIQTKSLLSP